MGEEDFVAQENSPIDTLDKLSKEMHYVMDQWLRSFAGRVDEGDLKRREWNILRAFSELKITEEWVKDNQSLAAMLMYLVNDRELLEKIAHVFDRWPRALKALNALKIIKRS
ncbi:hypothetical protein EOL99_03630 [Candidatus Falkowbacteria bacterium]|nr:hypothetical protein [Candidatus Falkowbacteria bacterium]